MKHKLLAIMLTVSMAVAMATGCGGGKETAAPAASTAPAETAEPVIAVAFTGETSFTAVQGEAINLSDLITDTEVRTGFNPKTITIQYSNTEFVIDTDADLPENKEGTDISIAMTKDATTLMNEKDLPNIALTFANVTSKPETLTVQMDLTNSKGEPGTGKIEIPITVVPKEISEVKELTENLKVSETLDNYDFDVRASNIQNKVADDSNIKSVAVKDSDVKFQTPGHYTVTYEVTFKEPIKVAVTAPAAEDSETTEEPAKTEDASEAEESTEQAETTEELSSVEIPTDVTIMGKEEETALEDSQVIHENVKPEEPKEEESKEEEKAPSKTEGNTSASTGNTSSGGSASSSSSSSGSGNASSSGSSPSGESSEGSSSSGGNSSEGNSSGSSASSGGSSEPVHVHNFNIPVTETRWVPNVVTVQEHTYDYICSNCGAEFYTIEDITAHLKENIKSGCYGYSNSPCQHITTVDNGYNEEYVAYYKCACGATQ